MGWGDVGRAATLGGAQQELTRAELLTVTGMFPDPLARQNYGNIDTFFPISAVSF
jgi:hypothetical protein